MFRLGHSVDLWAAVLAAPVIWGLLAVLWPDAVQWGRVVENGGPGVWRLFVLAGLYPAAEEWVFRGLVQGWMLEQRWGGQRLGPISLANGLTSALFAALHLFAHPPVMAMLVFLPSLVFGHARERTGGLVWPVGLHCWYNAGWFWIFGA